MQRAGTTRAEEIQREKVIVARLWEWVKSCLDLHVSRNQVFYSQGDYIWAMLIALGMNRRTVFKLATLLIQGGVTAAVPFVVVSFVLTFSMLLTDTHAGYFTGTGIVSVTGKLCPIFAGLGSAYTMYGFYQILRDFGDISLMTFFTLRSTWESTSQLCSVGDKLDFYATPITVKCINLEDAFCRCANNKSTSYATLPGLPAYSEKDYWDDESKGFAGGIMVASLMALLFISLLTLVNVRKFTRAIRWVVGPAAVAEGLVLLVAGLAFRSSGRFGACPMWADVRDLLSLKLLNSGGVGQFPIWVYSGLLAMEMLGAATCLASGLSRRMAQGDQYTPHLIVVVTVGVWFHLLFSCLYIIAAPTVVTDSYPDYPYSRIFLWDCMLFASETIKAAGMTNLSVLVMWFSVVTGVAARIFYNIDCLRNCATEYLSRWGYEEEFIDTWRSRVGPGFLLLAFFMGAGRLVTPRGVIYDEMVRNEVKESICRMICCILMVIMFYGFYGEEKVERDHTLVTQGTATRVTKYNIRLGRGIFNRLIYPIIITVMFIGLVINFDSMSGMIYPIDKLLGESHFFSDPMSPQKLGIVMGGWAYAGTPLLLIMCQALWALLSTLRKRKNARLLIQPASDWGPSEMRFWEGRYKHLFYDQGIVLDEEKDLQRVVLRMGKRNTNREAGAAPPADAPPAEDPKSKELATAAVAKPKPNYKKDN